MKSFNVFAIGNLAKDPELTTKGDTRYTRFCLIGNDYAGKDEGGKAKETVSSLWLVAFGSTAETIAHNARKGDQLIVEGHIQSNRWTDQNEQDKHDLSFIVDSFRFGAPGPLSRELRAER